MESTRTVELSRKMGSKFAMTSALLKRTRDMVKIGGGQDARQARKLIEAAIDEVESGKVALAK